jgi:hypothetical protein
LLTDSLDAKNKAYVQKTTKATSAIATRESLEDDPARAHSVDATGGTSGRQWALVDNRGGFPDPTRRFERARRGLNLIVSMVRLHPKPFAIAVSGASVFALCTVASAFAVRWVIDNVILPRFEEGSVAVGDRRQRDRAPDRHRCPAGGGCGRQAHVRRDHAVAVAADAHRRRDRPPRAPAVPWHKRRADGELVARAASTPTPRSACWRRPVRDEHGPA